MRRRVETPGGFNVWPAFTDVLGGLVVTLVFLITVFVIGEVLLGREMTSKDTAIGQLQQIMEHLERVAGSAEAEASELRLQVARLEATVADREQALAAVGRELAAARSQGERLAGTVEQARERAATLERERAESDWDVSLLQRQSALLSARAKRLAVEIERLRGALAVARDDLAGRDQRLQAQALRIEEMDALIKRRLVERVEELERYASDFFGRLREVFGDNPDIKVEGDRFVFQSEVLFSSGAATLSSPGRRGLDRFVSVYRQLEAALPEDLPVIIQVQGHTDTVPISTSRFRSNWELSAWRALEVVDYLVEQGVPPHRLAAVAMGEYHPVDSGDTPAANRRNRRIELKITSR